ncbi:MAG: glycosyltransferase [Acidobacteriaceae bacterium]|nr:glycosyltransferase [Acidobacteriaceae bacterium]
MAGLNTPRVAYFPDSFYEINGVAHTSRQFEAFVRKRNLPFLLVRPGPRIPRLLVEGNLTTLELPRGSFGFALEKDLTFDAGYARHLPMILRALREFRPDIIHITGPSENGILAVILANHLHLPLAASWHTNVHEYAARRAEWLLRHLRDGRREQVADLIEKSALYFSGRFYSIATILFAPNSGLCNLLEEETGRPCFLMQRGVDAEVFSPRWRSRSPGDDAFVLGFVGRLSVEKNVALLARVQKELTARGFAKFHFLIVGHGAEEPWLRENLPGTKFPGVLRGEALSRAYADMDLFVFPSHTDTFGNVVLEALTSGVPALVTPDGGPPSIVRDGETGFVARDDDFANAAARIMSDPLLHAKMRQAARRDGLSASWDSVFEAVYDGYKTIL